MKSSSRRSAIILALMMTMMVFTHSAGATVVPDPNMEVIDLELQNAMENEAEFPVIIQFSNDIAPIHRAFLIKHGIAFDVESDLLNGGLAYMDSSMVSHLSNHPDIRFLELDRNIHWNCLQCKNRAGCAFSIWPWT